MYFPLTFFSACIKISETAKKPRIAGTKAIPAAKSEYPKLCLKQALKYNNQMYFITDHKDFYNINEKLESIGLTSSYHKVTSDDYGEEKQGTFYHTKNIQKQYHIDYIYTKALGSKKLDIGSYSDWIKLSDHVPLIFDC